MICISIAIGGAAGDIFRTAWTTVQGGLNPIDDKLAIRAITSWSRRHITLGLPIV